MNESEDTVGLRRPFNGASADETLRRPLSAPAKRRHGVDANISAETLDIDKTRSTATVSTSNSSDCAEKSKQPILQTNARLRTAGSSRRAVTSAILSRKGGGPTGGRLRELISRANARTKVEEEKVTKILRALYSSQWDKATSYIQTLASSFPMVSFEKKSCIFYFS